MKDHKKFSIISTRRLIARICASVIFLCAVAGNLPVALSAADSAADSKTELPVLVEAEGFADTGGWVVDPQFMDLMGSPYLLAHGLGIPVKDAKTEVTIPKAHKICQAFIFTVDRSGKLANN
jgi:hypothetical protein